MTLPYKLKKIGKEESDALYADFFSTFTMQYELDYRLLGCIEPRLEL